MPDAPAPAITADHYRDALAICRATLANDEDGFLAILQGCEPPLVFQALVRLHISTVIYNTGSATAADDFLAGTLTGLSNMDET